MNSLGPCAFEAGPKTPVITNCASGNCFPNIAIYGMVPPSPIEQEGFLKIDSEAFIMDFDSQGFVSGAFQPDAGSSNDRVIFES